MKILFDDSACRETLVPFSLTRNISDFRIGILTLKEKWKMLLGETAEIVEDENAEATLIPANILPSEENYQFIIECCQNNRSFSVREDINFIEYPWQLFQLNDMALRQDFNFLTKNKTSGALSVTNKIVGDPLLVFLEEGVNIEHCILNSTSGPIYLGKNSVVMEGSMIRGPFAIMENSVVKMGSKIYGATTIGPNCVVGGEIKNSIFFENSNKAHDGYLGDSVIGGWCNLGAGSSCSNVKNTGGVVKYKITKNRDPLTSGLKGGLLMGDYSRCAINTSFNTGTTIGVCCNIFGSDYPEKYVDHFSWGRERYIFDRAIKDIDNWKKMKNQEITNAEIEKLKNIFYN